MRNVINSFYFFHKFNFFTLLDPIRLSLSSSFGSLMFQLVNQTTREKESGVYGALPKVCLVISQSHRIVEADYNSAQSILQGTMKQFPDLYFVFLSNDIETFRDMASGNKMSAKLVSNFFVLHKSEVEY